MEEARWKRREMEMRRRRRRRRRPRRSRRDDDSNIARGDAVTTSSLPLVQNPANDRNDRSSCE